MKNCNYLKWIISVLFISIVSCNQHRQQNQRKTIMNHEEGYVHVNGIKLHYLDWGSSKPPLVLIHGLGDSPYIFEDLASALKNKFRIIASSRRAHGKSGIGESAYDNTTLTSDLKLLLDNLKIDKANLLGWSMGGNEISEFAIRYPERVNKLIYFESGYDLSDAAFKDAIKMLPYSPFPESADLQTLEAYRKWYHQFWFADVDWNPSLEANIKASTRINSDSSVTTIPDDSISNLLLESVMNYHRDYTRIQAPSLAFYTKRFFNPPINDEQIDSVYNALEKNIISPWRIRNINQIKAELKNITVIEVPKGSHTSFIFLSKEFLVSSINDFLLK